MHCKRCCITLMSSTYLLGWNNQIFLYLSFLFRTSITWELLNAEMVLKWFSSTMKHSKYFTCNFSTYLESLIVQNYCKKVLLHYLDHKNIYSFLEYSKRFCVMTHFIRPLRLCIHLDIKIGKKRIWMCRMSVTRRRWG